MNDTIKNMLSQFNKENSNVTFERQVELLSNTADINTEYMYNLVFQKLLEHYKREPFLEQPYTYHALINFTYATDSTNQYGTGNEGLASNYNKNHSDLLVFYDISNKGIFNADFPFKIKKLEDKLKEDGIDLMIQGKTLIITIEVKKLKDLIQSSYNSNTPYGYRR